MLASAPLSSSRALGDALLLLFLGAPLGAIFGAPLGGLSRARALLAAALPAAAAAALLIHRVRLLQLPAPFLLLAVCVLVAQLLAFGGRARRVLRARALASSLGTTRAALLDALKRLAAARPRGRRALEAQLAGVSFADALGAARAALSGSPVSVVAMAVLAAALGRELRVVHWCGLFYRAFVVAHARGPPVSFALSATGALRGAIIGAEVQRLRAATPLPSCFAAALIVASCALDVFAGASVAASCAQDAFAGAPTDAARVAVVRQLRAWLASSPSHREGLVAARRVEEPSLSAAAAARAVDASLAAVGAATHLDVTALRALALAGGVTAHVLFAAHGARAARLIVLGAGARVLHVLVSGPRGDAHAERVTPAAFLCERLRARAAPLDAAACVDGGAWRIGSGRGRATTRGATRGAKRAAFDAMRQAACAAQGFFFVAMPGDGACFFHSVGDDLGATAADLRTEACDTISQDWPFFSEFLALVNADDYIEEMSCSTTYADEPEMVALERSRGIRIVPWSLSGDQLVQRARVRFGNDDAARIVNVFYTGNHYDALRPLLAAGAAAPAPPAPTPAAPRRLPGQ